MVDPTVAQTISALGLEAEVEVAWLYGSRATQRHSAHSDVDLAVALVATATDRMRLVDDIAHRVGTALALPVSVVDINRVPTPLAQNIITDGVVLLCRSDLRLRTEEQRVWSLWEHYKRAHEHNRSAL
jgi:predicted nucleotidyltransferase